MATVAHADPTPQELRAALSQPDALYEVVDGKIIEVPGMSFYASSIAERIRDGIRDVIRPARLGFVRIETVFIIDSERNLRRRPDVAFVSSERWPMERPQPTEGDLDVVPDLVVEVISPNDTGGAIARKRREYFRHGVRQVWSVEPETREVFVYRSPKQIEVFEEGDFLEVPDLLPGLRVSIDDLFSTAID
jgi:Uma2 family endonuclease